MGQELLIVLSKLGGRAVKSRRGLTQLEGKSQGLYLSRGLLKVQRHLLVLNLRIGKGLG